MRDAKKYFYRNGYVYGGITNFEHESCSHQTFRFTKWKEAQIWLHSAFYFFIQDHRIDHTSQATPVSTHGQNHLKNIVGFGTPKNSVNFQVS